MKALPLSFYRRENAVEAAKELIGKLLVSRIDKKESICRIIETEAYDGIADKASHAYGNRRTKRTETLYMAGGCAYVYLCYGIHTLFNVVIAAEGVPRAVLIRSGEPLSGLEHMALRTKKSSSDPSLTKGPGNITKAMGIDMRHDGISLLSSSDIFIYDDGKKINWEEIFATVRIGVDYAKEDALLPYRFYLKHSPWVSRK